MSVVGFIVVLIMVFLCSGFSSPLSPLLCFITVYLIICVSLCYFIDEVERTPTWAEHIIVIWSCIRIMRFRRNKIVISAPPPPPPRPNIPAPTPTPTPHPQKFSFWPFQGGFSVAVLCLCVCSLIYGVCSVLVCSSSLLQWMPRQGCALWLQHFLGFFNYILREIPRCTKNIISPVKFLQIATIFAKTLVYKSYSYKSNCLIARRVPCRHTILMSHGYRLPLIVQIYLTYFCNCSTTHNVLVLSSNGLKAVPIKLLKEETEW